MSSFFPPSSPISRHHTALPPCLPTARPSTNIPSIQTTHLNPNTTIEAQTTTYPDTWTNRDGLAFSVPYPRRPRVVWDSARTAATIHITLRFVGCGCNLEYKRDRKQGLPQTEPVALKVRAFKNTVVENPTVGSAHEAETNETYWDTVFGTSMDLGFGFNIDMHGDLGQEADLGFQWMEGSSVSAAPGHGGANSAFGYAGKEQVSEQLQIDPTAGLDASVVPPLHSLDGVPLTGMYCFVRDGECGLCRDLVGLTSRVWDEAAAEMMANVAASLEDWEAGWLGRRIRIRGEDGYVER